MKDKKAIPAKRGERAPEGPAARKARLTLYHISFYT
jgi:hypothetical protein